MEDAALERREASALIWCAPKATVSEYFFNPEEAPEFQGELYCPKCGCCTLKQVPRILPSIFEQAALWEKGEEWKPQPEDLGWVCSRGCSTTERHQ